MSANVQPYATVLSPSTPAPTAPENSNSGPVFAADNPPIVASAEQRFAANDPRLDTPAPQAMVPHKPKRTLGLWLTDNAIYGGVNNFGVFAISVVATYLTAKGGERNADGKLIYGEIGNWFQKRGDKLKGFFMKKGMSENQADMSKMVAFSFLDGTFVAPFVKLLEDRRESMAKWFDDKLGTQPENEAEAYKAEPKQSWGSVILGRFATAGIVVPTAVALDKQGLNDAMFHNPGIKSGEWAASKPKIVSFFEKMKVPAADLPQLFKTLYFEGFYTTVCTAGLYLSSRTIARFFNHHSEKKAQERALPSPFEEVQPTPTASPTSPLTQQPPLLDTSATSEHPTQAISQAEHHGAIQRGYEHAMA